MMKVCRNIKSIYRLNTELVLKKLVAYFFDIIQTKSYRNKLKSLNLEMQRKLYFLHRHKSVIGSFQNLKVYLARYCFARETVFLI